jgi:hypothetical protein
VWRALKQSYAEVRKLHSDVYPAVFARQEWTGTVYARRTLGNDAQVTAWYLAEHFLLAWSDWSGLCRRYLHYFGQPEDGFPRAWWNLDGNCRTLADQLLRDPALDELVSQSWLHGPLASRLLGHDGYSSRQVCHAIVDQHRRFMLLTAVASPRPVAPSEFDQSVPESPVWPRASDAVLRLNFHLIVEWEELPKEVRDAAGWHLRQYQRANLLASWLTAEVLPNEERFHSTLADLEIKRLAKGDALLTDARFHSALFHALQKDQPVFPTIEQFISQLNVEPHDRQTVGRVLARVQAAVADFGYDNFVEDVSASDFLGGDDSAVGSGAINLIPSECKGPCCTTLLAVSKGTKRALGFPSIVKQVREHLIRCQGTTRVVIVLCDHWFPGMLDDHLGDLRAHHDRGVRFLFLMVGIPGRVVSPVAVDLGLTP